jgi:hypothetical protein
VSHAFAEADNDGTDGRTAEEAEGADSNELPGRDVIGARGDRSVSGETERLAGDPQSNEQCLNPFRVSMRCHLDAVRSTRAIGVDHRRIVERSKSTRALLVTEDRTLVRTSASLSCSPHRCARAIKRTTVNSSSYT